MLNTEFIDKKLFHTQIHTYCKISYKENITENIQVILEYRKDKPGMVTGYLIGDSQTANSLAYLINMDKTYRGLHFKTVIREGESVYYESKNFTFKIITKSGAQIYTVGKINFFELYKINSSNQAIDEKKIYFQITPPYDVWKAVYYSHKEAKFLENVQSQKEKSLLFFDDFVLRIIKSELYESINNADKIISKTIYCIECIPKNNISDDTFIEDSKNFIDDILLITSLVSGHPISWYKYSFISKLKSEENIQAMVSYDKEGHGLNDLLIEDSDFKNFIYSVMPKYFDLKKNNIDLVVPIRSYLFSENATFLQQQFILSYVALENICNQLSRKYKLELCVDNKTFKNVREQLENLIKTFELNEIEKKNMEEKLIELNRNTVKYKFEQIFNKYKIDISDCYDSNRKIKFLSIRNQLIHSSNHNIDDDSLHNEYYRIRRYFELIILKILGWEKAISPYNINHNLERKL